MRRLTTLRFYWRYSRKYKALLAGLFVSGPIVVFATGFAAPFIAAKVLDTLGKPGAHTLSDFTPFIIAAIVSGLVSVVGGRVMVQWASTLEFYVSRDVANDVFKDLLYRDEAFHTERYSGALVAAANRLIAGYERIRFEAIYGVYPIIWAFIFTVIILVPSAPLYVLILVVISAVYIIIMVRLRRTELPRFKEVSAIQSGQTALLSDTMTNMTAVRAFGHEQYEHDAFARRTDERVRSSFRLRKILQRNEFISAGITETLQVASLFMAIVAVLSFHAPISTVLLIVSYTSALIGRLWNIQFTISTINRVIGEGNEMIEILQLPKAMVRSDGPDMATALKGMSMELKDISLQFNDSDKPLISDLSLQIPGGQKVGLVGPSGSGKTTVTKLFLQTLEATSGSILIGGHDVREVSLQALRENIAYIPQEPLLFHRTIAENIRYGKLDATDSEVQEAARQAQADGFIQDLPHGYDTKVGERGAKLSGGQRQRIAIARAIIKDAPILIMDEATSALDSQNEKLVQEAIDHVMLHHTCLVVAHRLSTVAKLDRILVMKDGTIIEDGTHEKLLERKGVYAELWAHQSAGSIV